MRILKNSLLAALFLVPTLAAPAQDAKAKSAEHTAYHKALGGASAVSCFNAQVALGHIAKADVSDQEKLKRAAGEAGGLGSGMAATGKMLAECQKFMPESEKPAMKTLIDLCNLVSAEANALIEVFKAKARKGEGLAEAEKNFAAARAKVAQVLGGQMGFPMEIVK